MNERVLTYLAVPYSSPHARIRLERFEAANRTAAKLMLAGKLVFSPISHTHPIAEEGGLPKGWEFWERYDKAFLAASKEIVVLTIDGWKESKGIAGELAYASEHDIPVSYLEDAVYV